MRILLISPKCRELTPEVYNVGLAYIAGVLREDGHDVALIDLNAYRYTKEQALLLIRAHLTRGDYQAVGIGSLITVYNYVKWLCEEIKKINPDIPIWTGNSVASSIPELFLQTTQADVVVLGEGESTVKELARATEAKTDLAEVNGIAYKKDGAVVRTAPRALIQDLDALPRPAYDLFDQEIYMTSNPSPLGKRGFCLGVSIRGCPYHCTYCYHAYQGARIRFQSPRRMVEDVLHARSRYDFDFFGWADDDFTAIPKRVYEFCDLIEKEHVGARWGAAARVTDITEDLLKRMKSAGCVRLGFGVESGSQKILDNIKKRATVEQARKALDLCKRIGIHTDPSLMINNVGETRETVQETVAFMKGTDCPPTVFFIATPYPDTELYAYGKSKGLIKDELALIRSYGEQAETLLVNFTDFSDEELLRIKKEAEQQMWKDYVARHPLYPLKVKLLFAAHSIRKAGLAVTFLKVFQWLARRITRDPKLRWDFLYAEQKAPEKMFHNIPVDR